MQNLFITTEEIFSNSVISEQIYPGPWSVLKQFMHNAKSKAK